MASSMGGGGGGRCDNHHQVLHLISEDVLIQILLWLPIMSLLRFKSVCKSWLSIIESPFFTNLRVITFSKLDGSSVLFNRGEQHGEEDEDEKRGKIFKLSGEEFEVFEDLGKPPLMDLGEEFEFLNWTFEGFVKFSVVGCCNGIICLHDHFSRNVILWNPAIKQSRVLPKPSNLLGNPNCCDKAILNDDDGYYADDFVMFGIDVKTMDYKVLLLTTYIPHKIYSDDYDDAEERKFMRSQSPCERRAHVYSLSTDSWRCIDATLSADHPYLQIDGYVNGGHYLNGSHFFMTSYMIKVQEHFYCIMPLIMSFDFTEEIFRTIQPPYDWRRNKNTYGCDFFIPFGEKLALVDVKADSVHPFVRICDVWVLNEQLQHGVTESWTKFYSLKYSYMSPIHLRCIANNGQFAIIYGLDPCQYNGRKLQKLRLLNLITGETKDLQSDSQGLQVDFDFGIYTPSIVQIGRSGATNEKV